jgi:hypothetical protein
METLETIDEREAPAFVLTPVRHGLRTKAMTLPGENRRDFNQLCDSLELEWRPRTPTEHFYVEQMAVSQWKLGRMQIVEYDAFDKNPDTLSQIPLLDRLMQCQIRLERSHARAQHDLQRLQKARPYPVPQPAAVEIEDPQLFLSAPVIDISTHLSAFPSRQAPDAKSIHANHPGDRHHDRNTGFGARACRAWASAPKTIKHFWVNAFPHAMAFGFTINGLA